MNLQRQRKLSLILFLVVILGIAVALVLYALRQNISLFYTPTEMAEGRAPLQRRIRVGGMVVPGSIQREAKGLAVHFKITDYAHTIDVFYRGILPDLFREGQGIVAQGMSLDKTRFNAMTVLAKHDEKYMPPEVKAALAVAQKNKSKAF